MSGLSPFSGSALVAVNTSGLMMSQTAMGVGIMPPAFGAARRNAKMMKSSVQA